MPKASYLAINLYARTGLDQTQRAKTVRNSRWQTVSSPISHSLVVVTEPGLSLSIRNQKALISRLNNTYKTQIQISLRITLKARALLRKLRI